MSHAAPDLVLLVPGRPGTPPAHGPSAEATRTTPRRRSKRPDPPDRADDATGLVERITLGTAREGDPAPHRFIARPGHDVVELEIEHGPALLLHPQTVRELLTAQAGAARARDDGTAALPLPTVLDWPTPGGTTRAAGASGGSGVRLRSIGRWRPPGATPVAELTAEAIARRVDEQAPPGLYRLSPHALSEPPVASDRVAEAPAADGPLLVLLHGTFSTTAGTFAGLWQRQRPVLDALFARYPQRVYGFEHATLRDSPVANALGLARTLPAGARLHLLTHSRGGLVAEVLARAAAPGDPLAGFDGAHAAPGDAAALAALAALLRDRGIRVERVVRVACPAHGTLLASGRLDAYVSVLRWTLQLAGVPVAPALLGFLGDVARVRTDPAALPGLQAMTPGSALVRWLQGADRDQPLPGDLRVVAGDLDGDSVMSWVKTLLADAFFWTDNDLVVQTASMYGGGPRQRGAARSNALFARVEGGQATHFGYFSDPGAAALIGRALLDSDPAGFAPLGPLSWAGESSSGTRAVRTAPRTIPANRPVLLLLPGLLGSHLAAGERRVWLSWGLLNRLDRLAWPDPGAPVRPDGALEDHYDALAAHLGATHDVVIADYDWRAPLEDTAARLAPVLRDALDRTEAAGQPVRLLAHSMGGLVARTLALEQPALWTRWAARPGARLLQLGTPNGGSWAPMQALSADDPFALLLGAVGLPLRDHAARQLMAGLPGFVQLQAGLGGVEGLHRQERWIGLAERDHAAIADATRWHTEDLPTSPYRWGIPPQALLDRALALRERLDAQVRDDLPRWRHTVAIVVGQARHTPGGHTIDPREGLTYLDAPDGGDGRVTLGSALLPDVPAWQAPAAHDALPAHTPAFDAYLDLLTSGQTQRLPRVNPPPAAAVRGAGPGTHPPRLRRARHHPPRVGDPPPGAPRGTDDAPADAALRVTVHHGNLKFLRHPLIVGHYGGTGLGGSESVVDRYLGGALSASLAAGLYPDRVGSHQVFTNHHADPENPLALPRPPLVVVCGLGSEGALDTHDLVHTLRQAVLAWALRETQHAGDPAGERPARAPRAIAATLIGSGGAGITPAAAARALARAVHEANERLRLTAGRRAASHAIDELHIVELYLDRATEAWHALRPRAGAPAQPWTLGPCIVPGVGGMARPAEGGYRGSRYDFVSAITGATQHGRPAILYTLDTRRARSEVRAQSAQTGLVRELVRRASQHAPRDPAIGRTLFQLLVPVGLEPALMATSDLLLELDSGTAAIPWELLDAPAADEPGLREPWALRSKLIRRLRTGDFRAQVSDARREDAVLIVGEPDCDPSRYARLPGARAEAAAVAEALRAQGQPPDRLHTLIAPDDAPGPDAAAVVQALLARRYRVVHLAGHGESTETAGTGGAPQPRGLVLSDGAYLGPDEVGAMRVVPELVFLNACHLGADHGPALGPSHDRAAFAAGIARQLIDTGVRCVVVAGWAVDDKPAAAFAAAFYDALLGGQRFMDAVHSARHAARRHSPGSHTWAAYQCYGDPDWVWHRDDAQRAATGPVATEPGPAIGSATALQLALDSLAVESLTQGAAGGRERERQRERLSQLEDAWAGRWGAQGAVAEAFGRAWLHGGDTGRALAWYDRARAAADGSASLRAAEQHANLLARRAWERWRDAPAAERGSDAFTSASADLDTALAALDALLALGVTAERHSLRSAVHKRRALIARERADDHAAQAALQAMARDAERAHALADAAADPRRFYPALNRLAADWCVGAALDEPLARRTREDLLRLRRDDPDFWSVVGLADLTLIEALQRGDLAAQASEIERAWVALHDRIGAAWLWGSVADQVALLLGSRALTGHPAAAALRARVDALAGRHTDRGPA